MVMYRMTVQDIPLAKVVEHLGGRYSHHGRKGETWWFSPFRPDERTASFVIHENNNTWHDFARTEKVNAHGGLIDLWTDFHNQSRHDKPTRQQAWKEIKAKFGGLDISFPETKPQPRQHHSKVSKDNEPRYKILKEPGRIWATSLKEELNRRCLSLQTTAPYLKQAHVEDAKTKKRFIAFAFENDNSGWEISLYNSKTGFSFKNCIGSKAPTSYLAQEADTVLIFESRWDFFTFLEMSKSGNTDNSYIISNGAGMSSAVLDILINKQEIIKKVLIYPHNDSPSTQGEIPPGEQFTNAILDGLEPFNITIGTMNDQYKGYKDLNEWWMAKRNTTLTGNKP